MRHTTRPRRRWWRRAARWAARGAAAALVADTLRLRQRHQHLPVLGTPDPGGSTAGEGGVPAGWSVLSRTGGEPDPQLVAAAVAHATAVGAEVLDVVPGDLAVDRALALLRGHDPRRPSNPLVDPVGAAEMLVATDELLGRAGLHASTNLDRYEMVHALITAHRHAPRASALVVAPALASAPPAPEQERAALRARGSDGIALGVQAAPLVLAAAGVATAGAAGVAAAAAWTALPTLVFAGGGPLTPADLGANGPLRWLARVRSWWPTRASTWRSPAEPERDDDADRAAYAAALAGGTAALFEERRSDCPWCGASELVPVAEFTDMIQAKPGTFHLERCASCSHVFQNPRLSLAGLDYYYRDFYDGRGSDATSALFGANGSTYAKRARMVAAVDASPGRWLDVGTGHGHFCVTAATELPDTTFDGLDMTDAIDEAERRGWVATGHRGMFPELAEGLSGTYDVVSMHHYLEHTRDPFAELDAARTVLRPGGHLLIEVPDPESGLARLLGRYWLPWFQPQHQHLVPIGNLAAALADRGFAVVATEHDPATTPLFSAAALLWANGTAPDPDAPWRPVTDRPGWARRLGVFTALAPALLVTAAIDGAVALVTAPFPRAGSNAYRLLARRL